MYNLNINYIIYYFLENYQTGRLKAKKAEDTSDLNSDNNKRKVKRKRFYDSDSSSKASNIDSDYTTLPSPPSI